MTRTATLSSIAEVERDTGVPRAALRIGKRRYGFHTPVREQIVSGVRACPALKRLFAGVRVADVRVIPHLLAEDFALAPWAVGIA